MRPRRTVVTGIGVVAPGGPTREQFWATITDGQTATRRITFFDPSPFRSQIAAECDFDPVAAGLTPRERRRADRYVQFALAGSIEAVADSGLELTEATRQRAGVVLGSAVGGTMRAGGRVRGGQRLGRATGWSTTSAAGRSSTRR